MKRAFAKVGDVRFLADAADPTRVWAQQRCTQGLEQYGVVMWRGWHQAGSVSVHDLRRADRASLAVRFAPHGGKRFRGSDRGCAQHHDAHLTDGGVRALLVALDAALEAGLPVTRKLRDLGDGVRADFALMG